MPLQINTKIIPISEAKKFIKRNQFYFHGSQIRLQANQEVVWNSQYPIRAITEFTFGRRTYVAIIKIKQSIFGFRHRCVITFYEWRHNALHRAAINHRHEIELPFTRLEEPVFYKLECVAEQYLAVYIPNNLAYVYDLKDLGRPRIEYPSARPERSQLVYDEQGDRVSFYSLSRPQEHSLVQLVEWNVETNQCVHKAIVDVGSAYNAMFSFFNGKIFVLRTENMIVFVESQNLRKVGYSHKITPRTRLCANTDTNTLIANDPDSQESIIFSLSNKPL